MESSCILETVNPANLSLRNQDETANIGIDFTSLADLDRTAHGIFSQEWFDDGSTPGTPIAQNVHISWDESTMNPSFGLAASSFGSSSSMQGLARHLESCDIDRPAPTNASVVNAMSSPSTNRNKRCRGRLLADLTQEGPETVFEDSDSHHSWTASDNAEEWVTSLREHLAVFRSRHERVALITSPLQTRQRRKVHSMANMWGLSHMSIGSGRNKRVLLCKCEMTGSASRTATSTGRRWNPSRINWSQGLVNTKVVAFDALSPRLDELHIRTALEIAGVPSPLRVRMELSDLTPTAVSKSAVKAYAIFETADDAALALLALDGTKPDWNAMEDEVFCDYVQFPPGFDFNDTLLDAFDTLPEAIRAAKQRFEESKSERQKLAQLDSVTSESETEDDLTDPGLNIRRFSSTSRTTSNASSFAHDPGYSSAGSVRSTAQSDYDSQASTSKKRKRVPKVAGGFQCSQCQKVFDREGDRRKHEKYHKDGKSNICTRCGKGFHFPKDLRRHMIVHSGLPAQESMGMSAPVSISGMQRCRDVQTSHPSSCSPPLSEEHLKQLYGANRSSRRRPSRAVSFE